ncbi:putative Transcriptional regulator, SARP family [metagenome]|uniref:Putative Transcriptional regulator, SARP family n=1 Tax=metagenome TaxID=256318 RepID=A0A2P2BWI8_9ZZZZ
MGIAVLGPVEVDGQSAGLAPRDRVVLSALVVRGGEPLSTEVLADALWGADPPASWAKVVHGCIARLRKRLGAAAIASGAGGYSLALSEGELDSRSFERLFERAREAWSGDDPERASYLVQEALDLWRGRALADVEDWEPGRVEAARLAGLRMDAEELRVEAETLAGRQREVLPLARTLVAQAPLRERRWALLATALHQTGQQAEALAALKQARTMLVDQLGLDPGRDLVQLEGMLLRQDPSLDPVSGREVSADCPYRGLLPYGTEDADSFFGREADVAACLRKLREVGALAIVGPSGVGKSSLMRAGVVASLTRGRTEVLLTTPGAQPTASLAGLRSHGRQVLVVDQAEEAVTTCQDDRERERYFAALAAHTAAGGALVLSLRADHLGDLAPYPDVTRILEDGLYLLGPMGESDLRSAIEGPARGAGLRLEPGLVDLLVRDVEGEPAALPLLSHVLRETWARREGPTLTVDGYRATGGIRDAVSRTAESLYDTMDEDQRTHLRSVLMRLVVPSEDGDPVRARVSRAKLAVDEEHRALLEQLAIARLVSIDGDSVQIAHEALVRVWPRLRAWLDDDVEGQRLFRHLASAADAWDAMERPDSELYRGTRLARTLEWRARADPELNDNEAAYLAASVALGESEARATEGRVAHERQINRRLGGALAVAGVLLVLTMIAGLFVWLSADRAERERDRAARERDRATQSAIVADALRAGAQGLLSEDLTAGLLLAVQGVRTDSSSAALENLGSALARAGALAGVRDFGREVGRPGTAHFSALAVSPDDVLVAVCLWSGGARMFDATTLMSLPFADSTHPCASLAFSPDGDKVVVAGSSDGQLRLYDVDTLRLSARQPGGFSASFGVLYTPLNHVDVAFSGDGARFVAQLHKRRPDGESARVGRVMVWDSVNPLQPVFSTPLPQFSHVALGPRGDRLYVATKHTPSLRVYDVDSGRLLTAVPDDLVASHDVTDAVLSPDGSTLAVATGQRVIRYDARTLQRRGPVLTGHTALVVEVAYSRDGRLLATSADDGTAAVWEGRSGLLLHRFEAGSSSLAFSGDGRLFAAGGAGLIQAWNVAGASRELALGEQAAQPDEEYALSLPAPDGQKVARVRSGRLWFEEIRTGRALTEPARLAGPEPDLAWSPDSRWLVAVDGPVRGPRRVVTVWDASTGSVSVRTERFSAREGAVRARFSQDAATVFIHDGTWLHTLDRATLRRRYPATPARSDSADLVPHPDGSVLVLQGYDGSFLRVDPRTRAVVDQSGPGLLSTEDLQGVVSADGTRMWVTGPQVRTRLLDLETKQYLGPDAGWQWGAPALSADGRQFAVAGQGRIRLWDGQTGEYQASLPLPGRVGDYAITYRPDGSGLVIVSTSGGTWTADTRTDRWDERACVIAGRNLSSTEWATYFPNAPYELTCPQWPAGI